MPSKNELRSRIERIKMMRSQYGSPPAIASTPPPMITPEAPEPTPIDIEGIPDAGAEAGFGAEASTISPGEQDAGGDTLMNSGAKMSNVAKNAMMGPFGPVKSAFTLGSNLAKGKLGLSDLSTGLGLASLGTKVGSAVDMGARTADIVGGLAKVNPLTTAASMVTTGILSELGFDQSGMGRLGKSLGGLAGSVVGPGGAALGQMVGGTLGYAASDLFGARSDEGTREGLEQLRGASGWSGWANPVDYIKAQRDYAKHSRNREISAFYGEDEQTPDDIMAKYSGEGIDLGTPGPGGNYSFVAGAADPLALPYEGATFLPSDFDEAGFDLDSGEGGGGGAIGGASGSGDGPGGIDLDVGAGIGGTLYE